MSTIYGNMVGGAGLAQTYILQDEDGNEITAVVSEEEVVLDATANDIRAGKTAATENGVVTGEKEIPAYHTTEGFVYIPVGSDFTFTIPKNDRYDFTKLQAIVCLYNTSVADSVCAEKVAIEKEVYNVNSTVAISTITIDHDNKAINLGITNDGEMPCIIRYFTYKEEI